MIGGTCLRSSTNLSCSPPLFIHSTSPLLYQSSFFKEHRLILWWRSGVYEERWRIRYGLATMELAGFGKQY